MYFGSFEPFAVMVLLEVMKSNSADEERKQFRHAERPSLLAIGWKKLVRWWSRPAAALPKPRPEASIS